MPILDDIMDHDVFGPLIRQGMEIGRTEGRDEARNDGERRLALRLLAQRFGPLREWAKSRIDSMLASDIERIAPRLLDAASLEDLFRRRACPVCRNLP